MEYRHIAEAPEGEREEVRQIYREKGFAGDDLEMAVDLITSDKQRWVKTMLSEEFGLPTEIRSPWIAGMSTFTAFIICGLIPLVPYLFHFGNSLLISSVTTGLTFFLIGSVRSRWSTSSWLRSGLETLFVGTLAASLAFGVGVAMKSIAG
ncbi:MAG TPA: hypothetical protein DEA22_09490, partial [Blastocatellia bacterium]|nr:hypothetical protein [Blastocatellia bacterium]